MGSVERLRANTMDALHDAFAEVWECKFEPAAATTSQKPTPGKTASDRQWETVRKDRYVYTITPKGTLEEETKGGHYSSAPDNSMDSEGIACNVDMIDQVHLK